MSSSCIIDAQLPYQLHQCRGCFAAAAPAAQARCVQASAATTSEEDDGGDQASITRRMNTFQAAALALREGAARGTEGGKDQV